jgi:hypothetical protein
MSKKTKVLAIKAGIVKSTVILWKANKPKRKNKRTIFKEKRH